MTPTNKILDVHNVKVSFDGFRVLDGLDFSMDYGELRFLIGPNGAGKTTLLDIITGKTRAESGKIMFDGKIDVMRHPEHKLVQYGIARKFQTPSIFASLTVFENLEAAIGFRAKTRRLLGAILPEQKARIMETLRLINLYDRVDMLAGSLSHGQKQWLEIGMLLVQQPKLLLLDEPIAGMTRQERDRTGELLQSLVHQCSILVVEHDMQFMRQFASVVTVLHAGSVLCEGAVESVQNDPRVIEVYLGHAKQRAA